VVGLAVEGLDVEGVKQLLLDPVRRLSQQVTKHRQLA
jgi:hypothetical protein